MTRTQAMQPFRETHPNSPLVEVVFEIRFPGETAIECRRHEMQAQLRGEYPTLLVPLAKMGEAPALQAYKFEKADSSAGVMLSVNRFSYYAKRYEGYELFKTECLRLFSLFGSLFPVGELNRIGLRHMNIIPFVRKKGMVPLDSFFFFAECLQGPFQSGFERFELAFMVREGAGQVTARVQPLKKKGTEQEAFLLDLDYFREDALHISQISKYLEEGHTVANNMFKRLVTEAYHKYTHGEEV